MQKQQPVFVCAQNMSRTSVHLRATAARRLQPPCAGVKRDVACAVAAAVDHADFVFSALRGQLRERHWQYALLVEHGNDDRDHGAANRVRRRIHALRQNIAAARCASSNGAARSSAAARPSAQWAPDAVTHALQADQGGGEIGMNEIVGKARAQFRIHVGRTMRRANEMAGTIGYRHVPAFQHGLRGECSSHSRPQYKLRLSRRRDRSKFFAPMQQAELAGEPLRACRAQ